MARPKSESQGDRLQAAFRESHFAIFNYSRFSDGVFTQSTVLPAEIVLIRLSRFKNKIPYIFDYVNAVLKDPKHQLSYRDEDGETFPLSLPLPLTVPALWSFLLPPVPAHSSRAAKIPRQEN